MDLSIIIVNWNSVDDLRTCISSILSSISSINFEIIVIDSGSFDGSSEMVTKFFPKVRFIQSKENLGFARANNEAFLVSRGRNLLFLNPDTEIQGNAIQTLLSELQTLEGAGIVGGKLLNTDRSIQTSCVQSFPTIMNQFLDAEPLRRLFPLSRLWGMAALFRPDSSPQKVDAVSGACLMIKRVVFEIIGQFNTDYFMYSEDVDLCFKVRQAGWNTYYIPKAVVVHHGGTSSSKISVNSFSSVMMLESRWRFFRQTRSYSYCILYRYGIFCASILRLALLLCAWPVRNMSGRGLFLENALRKWLAKLHWTLGGVAWVRKFGRRSTHCA